MAELSDLTRYQRRCIYGKALKRQAMNRLRHDEATRGLTNADKKRAAMQMAINMAAALPKEEPMDEKERRKASEASLKRKRRAEIMAKLETVEVVHPSVRVGEKVFYRNTFNP